MPKRSKGHNHSCPLRNRMHAFQWHNTCKVSNLEMSPMCLWQWMYCLVSLTIRSSVEVILIHLNALLRMSSQLLHSRTSIAHDTWKVNITARMYHKPTTLICLFTLSRNHISLFARVHLNETFREKLVDTPVLDKKRRKREVTLGSYVQISIESASVLKTLLPTKQT